MAGRTENVPRFKPIKKGICIGIGGIGIQLHLQTFQNLDGICSNMCWWNSHVHPFTGVFAHFLNPSVPHPAPKGHPVTSPSRWQCDSHSPGVPSSISMSDSVRVGDVISIAGVSIIHLPHQLSNLNLNLNLNLIRSIYLSISLPLPNLLYASVVGAMIPHENGWKLIYEIQSRFTQIPSPCTKPLQLRVSPKKCTVPLLLLADRVATLLAEPWKFLTPLLGKKNVRNKHPTDMIWQLIWVEWRVWLLVFLVDSLSIGLRPRSGSTAPCVSSGATSPSLSMSTSPSYMM